MKTKNFKKSVFVCNLWEDFLTYMAEGHISHVKYYQRKT